VTAAAWTFLAIAAVFAVLNWAAVARGSKPLEYVAKPATLVALIVVALVLDPTHADVRTWFVIALVLSLGGDVFLMLPRDLFVFGLASFLLGHVAYVVGFALHSPGEPAPVLTSAAVVIVAALLATRLLRGLRRGGHRELVVPVVAYVVVISTMVAMALASGNVLAAIGALLFMGSDSLIGETRFVQPRPWGPVAIMVTYHLGQAFLVLSLVR
jgi:uncharacterized membrane protein YhhN